MIEILIMGMVAVHNVKYNQDMSVRESHPNAKNYQIGRNFKKVLQRILEIKKKQILLKLKIKIYY